MNALFPATTLAALEEENQQLGEENCVNRGRPQAPAFCLAQQQDTLSCPFPPFLGALNSQMNDQGSLLPGVRPALSPWWAFDRVDKANSY